MFKKFFPLTDRKAPTKAFSGESVKPSQWKAGKDRSHILSFEVLCYFFEVSGIEGLSEGDQKSIVKEMWKIQTLESKRDMEGIFLPKRKFPKAIWR